VRLRLRTPLIATLLASWCVAVGVGIVIAFGYSTTAGAAGATPATWPADSEIAPAADAVTVVMFLHPQCNCSRASLHELADAVGKGGPPHRIVLAFADTSGDPADGVAWSAAAQVPGASRWIDHGGAEAARFGAVTSGFTVVYDARGALRFAGGVTAARGEVGDNIGRRELAAALAGDVSDRAASRHAVFGCAIGDAE
jgi:hypothetical protein